ncbi:hypothetical protein BH11ARM1_BH11ARM1_09720 [soil metagenome]
MVITILASVLLASQVKSDPQLTLGQLRALLPVSVRLHPRKVSEGWKFACIAAGVPTPPRTTKEQLGGVFPVHQTDRKAAPNPALFGDWKDADEPFVVQAEAFLETQKSRFDALDKALTYSDWSSDRYPNSLIPTEDTFGASDFPVHAGLKSLAKSLVMQSRVDMFRHHPHEAVTAIVKAHQTGTHLSTGEGPLIGYLVGIAIRAIADKEALRMSADLSSDEIERLVQALSHDDPKAEFAMALRCDLDGGSLQLIGATPDPAKIKASEFPAELRGHPFPLDRKATVTMLGRLVAKRIDHLPLNWSQQPDVVADLNRATASVPRAWLDHGTDALTPAEVKKLAPELRKVNNPLGLQYLDLAMRLMDRHFLEVPFRELERNRINILALRASAYLKDHGSLPKSLDDLAGTNRDPFSEKPFLYDVAKGTISSGPQSPKPYTVKISR